MAKTNKTRKVNYKGIARNQVAEVAKKAFLEAGWTVEDDAEAYGFKAGSLVINGVDAEGITVSIKVELSAPKAGYMTYDYRLEEEGE